jgi:hypothetical protein
VKALFGLIQMACVVGGFVALFNGQWLVLTGAWVAAGLVGLAGNRLVRGVDGVSQTGRDAMASIPRAIELLRRGEYRAATGVTRSAVSSFRMGGDKTLLPIALTVHAVALAGIRDVAGAEKAISEASRLFDAVPAALAAEATEMRQVHASVRRELQDGVPDPSRLVENFLAFNDTP